MYTTVILQPEAREELFNLPERLDALSTSFDSFSRKKPYPLQIGIFSSFDGGIEFAPELDSMPNHG